MLEGKYFWLLDSEQLSVSHTPSEQGLGGLVRRRGREGGAWIFKAEAKPFVVRLRWASPAMDHTDRNSVSEAATNWELVPNYIK